MASYADAFCLAADVKPHISFDGDSLYTIHDWYGVKGYDVCFRVTSVNDSSVIDVVNADMARDGYYYVKTGLPDKPIATIFQDFLLVLTPFAQDSAAMQMVALCGPIHIFILPTAAGVVAICTN